MHCNGIEVAFYDDHGFQTGNGLAGNIEREECLTLFEERCIRRVQILWRAFAENAPSESHHTPTEVDDGKHHATAKPIVKASGLSPRHRQSSHHQLAR